MLFLQLTGSEIPKAPSILPARSSPRFLLFPRCHRNRHTHTTVVWARFKIGIRIVSVSLSWPADTQTADARGRCRLRVYQSQNLRFLQEYVYCIMHVLRSDGYNMVPTISGSRFCVLLVFRPIQHLYLPKEDLDGHCWCVNATFGKQKAGCPLKKKSRIALTWGPRGTVFTTSSNFRTGFCLSLFPFAQHLVCPIPCRNRQRPGGQ